MNYYVICFFLALVGITYPASAQETSAQEKEITIAPGVNPWSAKVTNKRKREELIKIGQQAVLTYGKEYYREYGTPLVETYFVNPTGKKNVGRRAYRVTFYFDASKEILGPGFAARVYIWADTKQAYSINLGNGFGFGIPREKEE